jgi:hypothetical protein
MAIVKGHQYIMKKRSVTIQFLFHSVEKGVNLAGTAKKKTGSVVTGSLNQTYDTTMPFRSFTLAQYKGIDGVHALTDEQIDHVYQEMIDEVDSRNEVKSMFTFDLHRGQRGHIWLLQDNRGSWGRTTGEMVERNNRVVAQLVRFGFIDRLRPTRQSVG